MIFCMGTDLKNISSWHMRSFPDRQEHGCAVLELAIFVVLISANRDTKLLCAQQRNSSW